MGEGKPNTDQIATDAAPGNITAPEGSRADGVTDGANTAFGPTLDAVPHQGGETADDQDSEQQSQ